MAAKHGKAMTHHKGFPPINSYRPLNVCSREATVRRLSARIVTFCKGLPLINSHDSSM